MFIYIICLLVFLYPALSDAQRDPKSGWNKLQYNARQSMEMVIENMEGDPNSGVLYQAASGTVVMTILQNEFSSVLSSIPFSNTPSNVITYDPVASYYIYGYYGIGLDYTNPNGIWIAALSGAGSNNCAIINYNSSNVYTGPILTVYPFGSEANYDNSIDPCLIVSVVQCPTTLNVYATDIKGYRILKLTYSKSQNSDVYTYKQSILSTDTAMLCSDPTTSNCGTGTSKNNGPNGIVTWADADSKIWLLVSVLGTTNSAGELLAPPRLLKIDAITGDIFLINAGPNTPVGALQDIAGITIHNVLGNTKASILFVAGETPGTNGTVQVLTSSDNWIHYEMRTVLNSNCEAQGYNNNIMFNTTKIPSLAMANDVLILVCSLSFTYLINTVMDTNSGKFPSPVANTVANIEWWNPGAPFDTFLPESFSYDPNRNMLVLGSTTNGAIWGVPYVGGNRNRQANIINLSQNEVISYQDYFYNNWMGVYDINGISVNPSNVFANIEEYLPKSTDTEYSTACVSVISGSLFCNNVNVPDCYAFACFGGFNANPAAIGAGLIIQDLCAPNVYDAKLVIPGAVSANDVAVLNNVAYVTDTLGNQVFAVDINLKNFEYLGTKDQESHPILSNPRVVIPPSSGILHPDGIVAVSDSASSDNNGFIIVAQVGSNETSKNGNWKYSPSNKKYYRISEATGIFSNIDGMKFNQNTSLLFGTRNNLDKSVLYQSVVVGYSCDNWDTIELAYSFQTTCPTGNSSNNNGTNPPAIALIPGIDGIEDLVILCNNGFQVNPNFFIPGAPYPYLIVNDVNSVVANNKFNFCNVPISQPSTSSSGSSSISLKDMQSMSAAATALGVLFGLSFIVNIYLLYKKVLPDWTSGKTTINNPMQAAIPMQNIKA